MVCEHLRPQRPPPPIDWLNSGLQLFEDISSLFVPSVYSCALLRDILLQGRLYISRHWLCFYANLFGKDIKVAIPVVSVRLVKKHKTAGLVPNGLAITTDTGQKYVFVSLLSRDSVYDVLRRICTHLQVDGKSLSLKQFMEEPTLSLVSETIPFYQLLQSVSPLNSQMLGLGESLTEEFALQVEQSEAGSLKV
uniref:GRAM domain containing 2Aa n=1 Tax=Oryzias sinensis TaxID=183150 RepID=A0A8C8A1K7_9TELE